MSPAARPDRDACASALRRALEVRPEVLEAYLFGSVARGEARGGSDIDVAVWIDEALAPERPFGYDAYLASELMQALATNRVDVVILNRAPPVLYHRVLRDGARLVARDLARTTTREAQALSRYFDWLPQLAKLEQAHRRTRAGAAEARG